jgi:hypothetical protein
MRVVYGRLVIGGVPDIRALRRTAIMEPVMPPGAHPVMVERILPGMQPESIAVRRSAAIHVVQGRVRRDRAVL